MSEENNPWIMTIVIGDDEKSNEKYFELMHKAVELGIDKNLCSMQRKEIRW